MGNYLQQFYKMVLPPEKEDMYYCLVVFPNQNKAKPKFSRYANTIDALAQSTYKLLSNNPTDNIYYSLAQLTEKRRVAANVSEYRCFTIDLDAYESKSGRAREYKDHREAQKAFQSFLKATDFPKPNLVMNSGWGWHVYWVFTNNISAKVWNEELIPKVVAICDAMNLHIDANSMKSTQIMRPLGVNSSRPGPETRLVYPIYVNNNLHIPGYFFTQLDEIHNRVGAKPAAKFDYLPAKTSDGTESKGLFELEKIRKECKQIDYICNTRGNVSEPFWYAGLGILGNCVNGHELIHTYSKGHPNYSAQETDYKFNQWKTATQNKFTTCVALERAGLMDTCIHCKWYNTTKFASPIALGSTYESPIDILSQNKILTKTVISGFPSDIYRIKNGKLIRLVIEENGFVNEFVVFGSLFYLDSVYINTILNEEICRIQWYRYGEKSKPVYFELPVRFLAPGKEREFSSECGKYGMLMTSANSTMLATEYLRNYKANLDKIERPMPAYVSMGWQDDHTFILGPNLIHGREIKPAQIAEASTNVIRCCATKGEIAEWKRAIRQLNSTELFIHQFSVLNGFAAPLMKFTNLAAAQVHLYGETGSGKSTTHSVVSSIYGNPEMLRLKPIDTLYATYNRMGIYNHIPIVIDEITNLDAKIFQSFVYSLTQGEDRKRLESTSTEKQTKTWNTLVLTSGNKSVIDKLNTDPNTAQALLMRVLELNIPSTDIFSKKSTFGQQIIHRVNHNYGQAGLMYIGYLTLIGQKNLRIGLMNQFEKLRNNFTFEGEERFWETIFITTYVGGMLAKRIGLHSFDVERVVEEVYSYAIRSLRKHHEENKIEAEDILSSYINDNMFNAIIDPALGIATNKVAAEANMNNRARIVIRAERDALYIDATHLNEYLRTKYVDRQWFLNILEVKGILKSTTTRRILLTKGTMLSGTSCKCYQFKTDNWLINSVINDNVLVAVR